MPLEARHASRLRNPRYPVPFGGLGVTRYRLTTGARWAGPGGRLRMEVRLPVETVVYVASASYRRSTGRITWDLQDYEPSEDLLVTRFPS